jgi:transposase InsO family protein
MQIRRTFYKIAGYRRADDMLHSLRKFEESEVAKQRMKILKFYEQFGERATKEAFGADRKLISRWRKRLAEGGLKGLIPSSTRPNRVRSSPVPHQIVGFIKELREKHPRLGKEKIKVFLDPFCRQKGFKTISVSTIGKIIKRNHFFFQPSGRVYHDPDSQWAQHPRKKKKRIHVRYSPKVKDFGHILSDTVERVTDGVKDYFLSALDIQLKFALSLNYKRLTSSNMKDFYQRFKQVYPFSIKDWQSDNGHENLGEFDQVLLDDGIPHYFSYPHCPRINSFIERYNRTLQEEFIDNHLDIIHDKPLFSKALADYLIYYNTQRPHKSLGLKAPFQVLLSQGTMSQMCVTHTLP